MSSDLDALYKNSSAVLWVEDSETKAWLDAVWLGQSPTILTRVAGGHPNVAAVCAEAVDADWRHVFGLVDMDFHKSNRHRWTMLGTTERVYRLDVHETENLLLDPKAIAGCDLNTKKLDINDISTQLIAAARRRSWFVSCGQVLFEISKFATEGYPKLKASVATQAEAEQCILASDWFQSTATICPDLADPASIRSKLQDAHDKATTSLIDGSWRQHFPGKQIFREVSGYVQKNAPGKGPLLNLVKAIGKWQRENTSIPQQAIDLRQTIILRISC